MHSWSYEESISLNAQFTDRLYSPRHCSSGVINNVRVYIIKPIEEFNHFLDCLRAITSNWNRLWCNFSLSLSSASQEVWLTSYGNCSSSACKKQKRTSECLPLFFFFFIGGRSQWNLDAQGLFNIFRLANYYYYMFIIMEPRVDSIVWQQRIPFIEIDDRIISHNSAYDFFPCAHKRYTIDGKREFDRTNSNDENCIFINRMSSIRKRTSDGKCASLISLVCGTATSDLFWAPSSFAHTLTHTHIHAPRTIYSFYGAKKVIRSRSFFRRWRFGCCYCLRWTHDDGSAQADGPTDRRPIFQYNMLENWKQQSPTEKFGRIDAWHWVNDRDTLSAAK